MSIHTRAGAAGLAVALAMALGPCALAQGLTGDDNFTFKRVKPFSGQGPRITVQIDPEEQARRLAVAKPEPVPEPEPQAPEADVADAERPLAPPMPPVTGTDYAWYWDLISPVMGASRGDFPGAVAALSMGPAGAGVRAPRMQHMQKVAETYGGEILKATLGTRVSPALVLAVIGVESAGNPQAVSSAGAEGLMQLIPATAERFGVTDSKDPAQNIRGGVAYLDWLMNRFDGDPLMVLAAYNAGEGAVEKNGGVPPYAETRDYVPKVLAAWQVAQGLCRTPPMLVSDPCVFSIAAVGGPRAEADP